MDSTVTRDAGEMQTRERMLDAAVELFHRHSYQVPHCR